MKTTSKGIAILLLLAGLIMVTIITSFIPGQVDMTAENIYTLSDGSKALLKKIEEPVTLDYYFRRSAEEVPIRFKNFATRVEALLRQYESAGGGNIVVNIIDPKPDTEEEEEAIRSGISSQPLPSGENFFFGLKAIQAEQEKIIPIFDLQRESFLEYDISRTIHRVQQLDLPKLGVVSSLPVISGYQPGMMPPGQPPPEDWVFIQELRESFSIEQVAADGNNLPDDLDVLAIIHPAGLSDPLLYEIDQFALSGKPVFIAVDPSSNIQKRSMSQQQMMMGGMPSTSSDLPRLFDKWGIDYDPTYFVADLQYAESVVAGPGGSRVRYPAWLNIDKLSGEAPPTAELNRMFLVEPGSFNLREDSGLTLTPLLESSDQSGLLTASLLNFTPPDALARQVDPNGETHVLAGILHGKLTTAFPDGRPAVEAGDEEEAEDESKGGEFLSESIGESTLVLIADSDFLADNFSVRRINFLGMRGMQPLNDNIAFISNVLEYLAGSEDLISLRGKGTVVRPFQVVRDLEMIAQQKFKEEYEDLQSELSEVQAKLRQLQEEQGDRRRLVAGSEVRQLIEDYRVEEADKRAALRNIRKKLREDIESLERNLALTNLLTVPCLIGIAGVGFFYARHKRQKGSQA